MKLALPTLLLTSMASVSYAAASVGQMTKAGQKILKLKSQQPLDPRQVHLAPEGVSEVNRIINGEDAETADEGEFPFYIKLLELGIFFCGGSLIHEDIVLTAAHCDANTGNEVVIGADFFRSVDKNAETRLIETRMVHPNYDELTHVNDVMVLKIDSSSSLPTITLNDDSSSPTDGEDVVAIGLGETDTDVNIVTNPDVLQKITIPIIAHDQCAADWAGVIDIVDEVMLCAKEGGEGVCNGDSGGPLLEKRGDEYVQVGITSFGKKGCGDPNFPDVYTRVSGVKSWIDDMICELSDNPPASCSKPKTGLFVVLAVAGIAAIGLVAFLLKRRNNRKLQVSPQLDTESAAVVSAIPIKDGRTKAPVKVREEPSSKVKETYFEDVDLSDEHV